jgi:hypothetical protein
MKGNLIKSNSILVCMLFRIHLFVAAHQQDRWIKNSVRKESQDFDDVHYFGSVPTSLLATVI